MDSELKVFQQAFKELESLFQVLQITENELRELKDLLVVIQRTAENLAVYDTITHALNARGGKWLIPGDQLKGLAKIDIYDLRQANKVYGALVVDRELHKLSYQFMSHFRQADGDFVRRNPGSDEFRIFSTSKSPTQLKRMLAKLYSHQEHDSLLTWDFGAGLTETEAEAELQKQRKSFRPIVLRQTILESHSEIPRRIEENTNYQSWNDFDMPYESLKDKIEKLKLPTSLEQQVVGQVQITKTIVENIVTTEPLTGLLNGLAVKWYLEPITPQAVGLTDMLNMHEGNSRYGSATIDQDLRRFSNLLIRHFPKSEGFLLFRSARAGDEFKVASTKLGLAELAERLRSLWQADLHRGVLAWHYGVGRDDSEAHVDLYRNRVKETEIMDVSTLNGKSTFIIVRPDNEEYSKLFELSEETARVTGGAPIIDLHLTVQAIRNVEDFEALAARLADYARSMEPFEVKVRNIARMNVNNQQGRLWLLAERSATLEKLYNDLAAIAREIGCDSYPYKSENWLPHIKIVELPEDGSTRIKDPTFGAKSDIMFTVRRFEWTVQRAPERWEMLQQFSFPA